MIRFIIVWLALVLLAAPPVHSQTGTISPFRHYLPIAAGGVVTIQRITYHSSIDDLTLTAIIAYPAGAEDLPVVAIMHGFDQQAAEFGEATIRRFAGYGLMAVFVDMRGRGDSGGERDIGGREIQDIVDAVNHVIATYPAETDATQIHIVGYSGGGGNVYSALAKFPDFFNSGVAFFGISDYGDWYKNGGNTELMDRWIGGSPAAYPERYQARSGVLGITNYTGGHLWMFHDADDGFVRIAQTVNVVDALNRAGLNNFEAHITTELDSPRWLHGLPNPDRPVVQAEAQFIQAYLAGTYPAWTVPETGTLTVIGHVQTKRFSVWLRAVGSEIYGVDAVAIVDYGVGSYRIIPLSGSVEAKITIPP